MKPLQRRVAALEGPAPTSTRRLYLDGLSDDELERLEPIVMKLDAGTQMSDLSDGELRFLASLPDTGVDPIWVEPSGL